MYKNEFNRIEKFICAAYDLHNHFRMSNIKKLWFLLFTKLSDNKLRNISPTKEALQLYIICSVSTSGRIFSCTCKRLCIQCKCVNKEVFSFPFCSFICIVTREHSLYYIGKFFYTSLEVYLETSQMSLMELFCQNI